MLSIKKLTLTGALLLVLLAAPFAVVNADINGLEPDDFFSGFNTSRWVADPLPEYSHNPAFFSQQTAGAESYLQIAVPAGTKRSLSGSNGDLASLQAPRVMQAVSDDGRTPFTVTVKFLGAPSFADGSYAAMQGIVVKGTYDHDLNPNTLNYPSYWRFSLDSGPQPGQVDLYSTWFYQTGDLAFGGFSDIYPTSAFSRSADLPFWLQVERTVQQDGADYWSTFHYRYSLNGTNWTSLVPKQQTGTGDLNRIRQTFVVTHVGVFAGTTGDNPAYTAKVDWVSITSGSPANEDQGQQPTTFTLSYNANPTGGSITGTSSGSHPAGTQVTLTADPNPGFIFSGWTVNSVNQSANPLTFTLNANTTVSASFTDISNFTERVYLPMVIR